MLPSPSAPLLIGREAQLTLLRDFRSRVPAGTGGALLVRGDAGAGKTRLVTELADRGARGRRRDPCRRLCRTRGSTAAPRGADRVAAQRPAPRCGRGSEPRSDRRTPDRADARAHARAGRHRRGARCRDPRLRRSPLGRPGNMRDPDGARPPRGGPACRSRHDVSRGGTARSSRACVSLRAVPLAVGHADRGATTHAGRGREPDQRTAGRGRRHHRGAACSNGRAGARSSSKSSARQSATAVGNEVHGPIREILLGRFWQLSDAARDIVRAGGRRRISGCRAAPRGRGRSRRKGVCRRAPRGAGSAGARTGRRRDHDAPRPDGRSRVRRPPGARTGTGACSMGGHVVGCARGTRRAPLVRGRRRRARLRRGAGRRARGDARNGVRPCPPPVRAGPLPVGSRRGAGGTRRRGTLRHGAARRRNRELGRRPRERGRGRRRGAGRRGTGRA